ncbi:hypothetical protein [Neolewinella aurantiaca]|nr:hypothetical protein [Neolewinella aurantiaca]
MINMLLKFPPILGGNGDATAYIVLAVIILLLIVAFYTVYKLLQQDAAE